MFGDQRRAEAQREELAFWLQRKLGERKAHLVWIAAVVILTAYVGYMAWFVIAGVFQQMGIPRLVAIGIAALLTIMAPWVIAKEFVPDTEPWARGARRLDGVLQNIGRWLDDALAIVAGLASA